MQLRKFECSNQNRFISIRIQSLVFRHSLSITVLTHAPIRGAALVSRDGNGRPGAGPMGVVRLVFFRSMMRTFYNLRLNLTNISLKPKTSTLFCLNNDFLLPTLFIIPSDIIKNVFILSLRKKAS